VDFWGHLPQGPYNVGYQRTIITDPSRANVHAKEPKKRPLILNTWYPTLQKGSTMLHHAYLDFEHSMLSPELQKAFTQYNLEMIETYAFDEKLKSQKKQTLLLQMLNTPTHAIQNAAWVDTDQIFPLIVFHQGLGASIEDNAAMHEWLASHGYIIINTSYQSNEPGILHVDWDLDTSIADIHCMLDHMLQHVPGVSRAQIGIMGQSYGAQAALAYAAKGKYQVQGVITLDSTIDYTVDMQSPGWAELFETLWSHKDNLTMPVLAFADQAADFVALDRLTSSNRTYAKTKELYHQDYVAQGAIGARLQQPFLRRKQRKEVPHRWASYQDTCRVTLEFWNQAFDANRSATISKDPVWEPTPSKHLTFEIRRKGQNHWDQTMRPIQPVDFPKLEGTYRSKLRLYRVYLHQGEYWIHMKKEKPKKIFLFQHQLTQSWIIYIDDYALRGTCMIEPNQTVAQIVFNAWGDTKKTLYRIILANYKTCTI
jgi:pimeloyl-ACP methyl ester carboxylesterase